VFASANDLVAEAGECRLTCFVSWRMNEKRRCSILFHLLVPGGKWHTVTGTPSSSASFWSSIFHNRTREPLLPPPDRNNPAMPGRPRLGGRETPPPTLVEYRSKRLEALAYGRFVNHAKTI